jgi:mRNA interferase HigB
MRSLIIVYMSQSDVIPKSGSHDSILWKSWLECTYMLIIGTDLVERYFAAQRGGKGLKAARAQYDVWRAIVEKAHWRSPQDVKQAHPKASILKGSRVVFNIKANDYRLVAVVQYQAGVLMIRFFGSHQEYDQIDAESV